MFTNLVNVRTANGKVWLSSVRNHRGKKRSRIWWASRHTHGRP